MAFELRGVKARMTSYNARSETHGKEEVPACDLRFEAKMSNDILSHFGSQLRHAFFWKSEGTAAAEGQGELPVGEIVSDLPNLRNPKLQGPFVIHWEGSGYSLVVDYGLGERSNIEIMDCKVQDVKFVAHEGGAVTLTWRVSKAPIEERERGKLSGLVKHELTLDLTGPRELPLNDVKPTTPQAERKGRGRKKDDAPPQAAPASGDGASAGGRAFPDSIDGTGPSWPYADQAGGESGSTGAVQ